MPERLCGHSHIIGENDHKDFAKCGKSQGTVKAFALFLVKLFAAVVTRLRRLVCPYCLLCCHRRVGDSGALGLVASRLGY